MKYSDLNLVLSLYFFISSFNEKRRHLLKKDFRLAI